MRALERVQQRSSRSFRRRTAGCDRSLRVRRDDAVVDARVAQIDFELGGAGQGALNQRLGKRILDVFLQCAPRADGGPKGSWLAADTGTS